MRFYTLALATLLLLSPGPVNHGYYGYLPTPRHHDLGGYETWLGTNRLERRASEKMLETLIGMTGDSGK